MEKFTPKNYPWRAISRYEDIDAYKVLEIPVTSQRLLPCYVPKDMRNTHPLKFPNMAIGIHRNPIHGARTALRTRYDSDAWFNNQKKLMDEVTKNIEESVKVTETLEDMIKIEKNKLKETVDQHVCNKKASNESINEMKVTYDEMRKELQNVLNCNSTIQDLKRELQFRIQNLEAPLQISQECLYHRETRPNSELVNDKVEQMLLREIEIFPMCQKQLQEYLEHCDSELMRGRKLQGDLESFVNSINWIVCVDKSITRVTNFAESDSWKHTAKCISKKIEDLKKSSLELKKQIELEIRIICKQIANVWKETNDALAEREKQGSEVLNEIYSSMSQLKNKMINIEKNLKYLITKRSDYELQEGRELLESFYQTKKNLLMELEAKTKSLFIDRQKCITIRNCYPISVITSI